MRWFDAGKTKVNRRKRVSNKRPDYKLAYVTLVVAVVARPPAAVFRGSSYVGEESSIGWWRVGSTLPHRRADDGCSTLPLRVQPEGQHFPFPTREELFELEDGTASPTAK